MEGCEGKTYTVREREDRDYLKKHVLKKEIFTPGIHKYW